MTQWQPAVWWQSLNELAGGQLEFWLAVIGVGSVVLFIGSMFVAVYMLLRLPQNYFLYEQRSGQWQNLHPLAWLSLKVVRNGAGIVVIAAGIAMLVLPGQGVLTIVVGLSLIDMPFKRRVLQYLLKDRHVRGTLNWIRRRFHRPPFKFP